MSFNEGRTLGTDCTGWYCGWIFMKDLVLFQTRLDVGVHFLSFELHAQQCNLSSLGLKQQRRKQQRSHQNGLPAAGKLLNINQTLIKVFNPGLIIHIFLLYPSLAMFSALHCILGSLLFHFSIQYSGREQLNEYTQGTKRKI